MLAYMPTIIVIIIGMGVALALIATVRHDFHRAGPPLVAWALAVVTAGVRGVIYIPIISGMDIPIIRYRTIALGLVGAGFVTAGYGLARTRRYPTSLFMGGTLLTLATAVFAIAGGIGPGLTPDSVPNIIIPALLATFAFGYNVSIFLRFGPRTCRACGETLELLDESADDAHLDDSEQMEEKYGSIDYNLWQCPRCQKIIRQMRRNSNLEEEAARVLPATTACGQCPACQRWTLLLDTFVRMSGVSQSRRSSGSSAIRLSLRALRVQGYGKNSNHQTQR